MVYSEILKLRTKHRISQIKLAEYSGYTPAMISGWELNKAVPTLEQIKTLSATISSILINEKENGIDIRKKRIQHSGKPKGETQPPIKSAADYRAKISEIAYMPTPYTEFLNGMSVNVNPDSAPKAIALFAGCGGMTLGFAWAGFNVLGHIEINDSANKIYAENFPDSSLLGTDIKNITDAEVRSWVERFGGIDILIGGPPCQGFSLAGKRNPNDERSELFQHYIRIVNILHPKVFVMENVRLMTSMKDPNGNLFIDKIIDGYKNIGYSTKINYVDAQDFGVPQFRERAVVVGINSASDIREYEFPTQHI